MKFKQFLTSFIVLLIWGGVRAQMPQMNVNDDKEARSRSFGFDFYLGGTSADYRMDPSMIDFLGTTEYESFQLQTNGFSGRRYGFNAGFNVVTNDNWIYNADLSLGVNVGVYSIGYGYMLKPDWASIPGFTAAFKMDLSVAHMTDILNDYDHASRVNLFALGFRFTAEARQFVTKEFGLFLRASVFESLYHKTALSINKQSIFISDYDYVPSSSYDLDHGDQSRWFAMRYLLSAGIVFSFDPK